MSVCKLFRLFWYIVFYCLNWFIVSFNLEISPIVSLYLLSFYIDAYLRYRSASASYASWWTSVWSLLHHSTSSTGPHSSSKHLSIPEVLIKLLGEWANYVSPTRIFWYSGRPTSAFSRSGWSLVRSNWLRSSESANHEACSYKFIVFKFRSQLHLLREKELTKYKLIIN